MKEITGKKYRALQYIRYNPTLVPEKEGIMYAEPGDILDLEKDYPQMAQYPEYVQIWLDMGAIEELPEVQVKRLGKIEPVADKSDQD